MSQRGVYLRSSKQTETEAFTETPKFFLKHFFNVSKIVHLTQREVTL